MREEALLWRDGTGGALLIICLKPWGRNYTVNIVIWQGSMMKNATIFMAGDNHVQSLSCCRQKIYNM
ncbi:hypothetical protein KA005_37295 [bacterium]|nr:hypothetical protein [bacterium]